MLIIVMYFYLLEQNSISARDIVKVVDGPHMVCVFVRVCLYVCVRTCVCVCT